MHLHGINDAGEILGLLRCRGRSFQQPDHVIMSGDSAGRCIGCGAGVRVWPNRQNHVAADDIAA
ncbi:conserved hypothetical protein (plasmid) [Sinorhizobium fredii HH103]|nr:conserved hypothetical protein [Sinorhizobium fredii HH103]